MSIMRNDIDCIVFILPDFERNSEKPCLAQGELNHEQQQQRDKYEEKLLGPGVSQAQQKFEAVSVPDVVEKGRYLRCIAVNIVVAPSIFSVPFVIIWLNVFFFCWF